MSVQDNINFCLESAGYQGITVPMIQKLTGVTGEGFIEWYTRCCRNYYTTKIMISTGFSKRIDNILKSEKRPPRRPRNDASTKYYARLHTLIERTRSRLYTERKIRKLKQEIASSYRAELYRIGRGLERRFGNASDKKLAISLIISYLIEDLIGADDALKYMRAGTPGIDIEMSRAFLFNPESDYFYSPFNIAEVAALIDLLLRWLKRFHGIESNEAEVEVSNLQTTQYPEKGKVDPRESSIRLERFLDRKSTEEVDEVSHAAGFSPPTPLASTKKPLYDFKSIGHVPARLNAVYDALSEVRWVKEKCKGDFMAALSRRVGYKSDRVDPSRSRHYASFLEDARKAIEKISAKRGAAKAVK